MAATVHPHPFAANPALYSHAHNATMATVPQRPAPAVPAPSSGSAAPDPHARPDAHSTATASQPQKTQGASQMPMKDVAAALPAVPAPAASVAQQQPPQPDLKPKEKEKRKIRFSVGTEYKVEEIIGEGAYGVVCSATHLRTGVRVAIKKVSPFDHSSEFLRLSRERELFESGDAWLDEDRSRGLADLDFRLPPQCLPFARFAKSSSCDTLQRTRCRKT